MTMVQKKRDVPREERLTLAQARAQISALKPTPPVEGKGGGAAVPRKEIRQDRTSKVKR